MEHPKLVVKTFVDPVLSGGVPVSTLTTPRVSWVRPDVHGTEG